MGAVTLQALRGLEAWAQEARGALPGPDLANGGGHGTINTASVVHVVVVIVTIIITGNFTPRPPGPKDGAAGWRAPADPPRAQLLPRRPRAAGALKSQSGK